MHKGRATVTVDKELLREAKAMGINLSETLETSLRAKVSEEATRRWREENRSAIDAFNRYVDERGTIADRMRARRRTAEFAKDSVPFEAPGVGARKA